MPSDRTTTTTTATTQADADEQDARAARKGGNPLQRGSACLSCRKRKMKCDATKPVCRQCVKANRPEECDYDDGRQKSRTQILQEKIAKLEDRIRELEGAEDGLGLEQPYDAFGQPAAFGEEFGSGAGDAAAGFGFAAYHSPAGSGSASGSGSSNNGQSFSPLTLDTSTSYPGPSNNNNNNMSLLQSASPFYPALPSSDVTAGAAELFGFPASPSGSARSGSGAGASASTEAGPSGSNIGHGWAATSQQEEQMMNSMFASTSGMGMELGLDGSMALGMNMGGAINSGMAAMGMGMGMSGDTSMAIPTYGAQDFSAFAGVASSQFSNTVPSISRRPAFSFSNPGSGPSSLSIPSSNTRATLSGGSKGSGHPMSRWDADVLPVQERKILVDIFLPHARQCGLDLSPERLYQRLELDSAYPSIFPRPRPPHSQSLRAPPAHPALAHAIYLLACHFSAVHVNTGGSGSGKQTDLSSHEPHFLTRALRGIAAALEAGEAAASDSSSSRSSRSSRSARSSYSPCSTAASPASAFQTQMVPGMTSTGLGGGTGKDELDAATPLVDAVQASALLAVYFFAKARLLEGYYHASAAARLAVSLGMHQVRSAVWRPPVSASSPSLPSIQASAFDNNNSYSTFPFPSSNDDAATGSWSGSPTPSPAVLLPPARSALEHAERVSTFWGVFFVDRCWSVATGLPSSLPDDEHPQLKISTVWPWDADKEITRENADYESLGSLFNASGVSSTAGMRNKCTKALKAKAAAFFERAARIASMQSEPNHWEQLTQLEVALRNFIAGLPPYSVSSSSSSFSPSTSPSPRLSAYAAAAAAAPSHPSSSSSSSSSSRPTSMEMEVDVELALVHTLAHAAVIQLHHPRAQKDARAHGVCVRAAAACCRVVRCLGVGVGVGGRARGGAGAGAGAGKYALLDPVVGTCWMCVSDVLLRERMWGGDMRAASASVAGMEMEMEMSTSGGGERFGVEAELDAVVGALRQLSYVFPVALYQVQKVEQSRNAAF